MFLHANKQVCAVNEQVIYIVFLYDIEQICAICEQWYCIKEISFLKTCLIQQAEQNINKFVLSMNNNTALKKLTFSKHVLSHR